MQEQQQEQLGEDEQEQQQQQRRRPLHEEPAGATGARLAVRLTQSALASGVLGSGARLEVGGSHGGGSNSDSDSDDEEVVDQGLFGGSATATLSPAELCLARCAARLPKKLTNNLLSTVTAVGFDPASIRFKDYAELEATIAALTEEVRARA